MSDYSPLSDNCLNQTTEYKIDNLLPEPSAKSPELMTPLVESRIVKYKTFIMNRIRLARVVKVLMVSFGLLSVDSANLANSSNLSCAKFVSSDSVAEHALTDISESETATGVQLVEKPIEEFSNVVVVAETNNPPYSFVHRHSDSQSSISDSLPPRVVGMNVDIVGEVCRLAKISCTFKSHEFNEHANLLESGAAVLSTAPLRIDLSSRGKWELSRSIYPQSARWLINKPAQTSSKSSADNPQTSSQQLSRTEAVEQSHDSLILPTTFIQWLASRAENGFDETVIAVVDGSVHSEYLSVILQTLHPFASAYTKVRILPSTNALESLNVLRAGKADAVFSDERRLMLWSGSTLAEGCCALLKDRMSDQRYLGYGVALPMSNSENVPQQLRRRINQAITHAVCDGTINAIMTKWLVRNSTSK